MTTLYIVEGVILQCVYPLDYIYASALVTLTNIYSIYSSLKCNFCFLRSLISYCNVPYGFSIITKHSFLLIESIFLKSYSTSNENPITLNILGCSM